MKSTTLLATLSAVSALTATAGFVTGRCSTLHEQRATRQALAEARQLASVDALTGLANRTGLFDELARRAAGTEPYTLLLIDLDRFKAVNDTHGHAAGDLVLIEVASRLSALVAGAGIAARLGGDEFVVVASRPTWADSTLLGHEVAQAVVRPIAVTDEVQACVGASVGLVQATPGDDPRALLRSADIAMYQAKRTRAGAREYGPAALADTADQRPRTRRARLRDRGLVEVGRRALPDTGGRRRARPRDRELVEAGPRDLAGVAA